MTRLAGKVGDAHVNRQTCKQVLVRKAACEVMVDGQSAAIGNGGPFVVPPTLEKGRPEISAGATLILYSALFPSSSPRCSPVPRCPHIALSGSYGPSRLVSHHAMVTPPTDLPERGCGQSQLVQGSPHWCALLAVHRRCALGWCGFHMLTERLLRREIEWPPRSRRLQPFPR